MHDPWSIVRLAEIADIGTGVTLGRDLGDSYSVEYPYLRVANVQDGHIDTSDVKNIRIFSSELTRYQLQAGDILLTEGGDFDKLGRGAVWDGRIPTCLHQNHIFRVRLRSDFSPQFFSAYMRSAAGRAYFLSCAKQTTNLASINKTQLSAMPVPVPPPSEQQRIAEILDSIETKITDASRSEAKLASISVGLRSFIFSNLDAEEGQISDFGRVITGSTPPVELLGKERGVPFVTPAELGKTDVVATSPRMVRASSWRGARVVPGGSMLAVCIGFSLGKLGVTGADICTNQQINALAPRYGISGHYLLHALGAHIERLHRVSAIEVTPIVTKSTFSAIKLPCPSARQQVEIVDRMRSAQALIEAQRAEVRKLQMLKQSLMDDLITGRMRVSALCLDVESAVKDNSVGRVEDLVEVVVELFRSSEGLAADARPFPDRPSGCLVLPEMSGSACIVGSATCCQTDSSLGQASGSLGTGITWRWDRSTRKSSCG